MDYLLRCFFWERHSGSDRTPCMAIMELVVWHLYLAEVSPNDLTHANVFITRCDHDYAHRKPSSNPEACWSPAILSYEFPSIRRVGRVHGGRFQDSRFIDRMKRHTTTMLWFISTLSFLYTTLYFIYSTFIQISFSHSFNFFVLITHHLFNS